MFAFTHSAQSKNRVDTRHNPKMVSTGF